MFLIRIVIAFLGIVLSPTLSGAELETLLDRFARASVSAVSFEGSLIEIGGFPSFVARLSELELSCHVEIPSDPDFVLFCPGPRQDYDPGAYDLRVHLRNVQGGLVVMAAWRNNHILLGRELLIYLDELALPGGPVTPALDVFGLPQTVEARPAAFAVIDSAWP